MRGDKVSMRKSADKRNLFDQNEIFLVDDRTACKIGILVFSYLPEMIRNKNATALVRRTVFYGLAGTWGVNRRWSFLHCFRTINQNLEISNIFTYALGSAVSFSINSRLTFRSPSQRLSARRFFLICILG